MPDTVKVPAELKCKKECRARSGSYLCTRNKGHEGDHVGIACGTMVHNIASWPQVVEAGSGSESVSDPRD